MGAAAKATPLGAVAALVCAALLSPDHLIHLASRYDKADQPPVATSLNISAETSRLGELGVRASQLMDYLLVISPKDPQHPPDHAWLAKWLIDNQEAVRDAFFRHGALIFRGFDVKDAIAFEHVVLSITSDLATAYLGTSPRSSISGTTYVHSAADFQQHRTLPTHLEMSFRDNPPKLQIFFASKIDHIAGGETPLTDFQGVLETLREQESFRRRFETGRVQYTRNNDDCSHPSIIDPMMQKCWQDMYKTEDRDVVSEKCRAESFNCTWDEAGRMQMVNSQPWIRKHPVTGADIFFNHINVLVKESMVYDFERTAVLWGGIRGLWPAAIGLYYRALFAGLDLFWPESRFGSSAAFADGEPISQQEFYQVKRAVWRNTIQQPYQLRDIVLVDNMRVGHGREMYMGPRESRKIMTAWSDNFPPNWVN